MSDDGPDFDAPAPQRLGTILRRLGIDPAALHARTGLEHQAIVATTREAVWHRACLAGRCRYGAGVSVEHANPPAVDSTNTCGGYHGAKRLELPSDGPGVEVWRWRPCARHVAWQVRRAAWLHREREVGTTKKLVGVTHYKAD